MTIGPIPNLTVEGERVVEIAQLTKWSCHETFWCQIHNRTAHSKDGQMAQQSGYNPRTQLPVSLQSCLWRCHDKAGRDFCWVWNQTELNNWSKPGPLAAYPDMLLSVCAHNLLLCDWSILTPIVPFHIQVMVSLPVAFAGISIINVHIPVTNLLVCVMNVCELYSALLAGWQSSDSIWETITTWVPRAARFLGESAVGTWHFSTIGLQHHLHIENSTGTLWQSLLYRKGSIHLSM